MYITPFSKLQFYHIISRSILCKTTCVLNILLSCKSNVLLVVRVWFNVVPPLHVACTEFNWPFNYWSGFNYFSANQVYSNQYRTEGDNLVSNLGKPNVDSAAAATTYCGVKLVLCAVGIITRSSHEISTLRWTT